MNTRKLCAAAALGIVAALGGALTAGGTTAVVSAARLPETRAERTAYRETSTFADVVGFLDSLLALGAPMRIEALATTNEGRELPLVILSRPLVSDPVEARRLGRPVVFVQGNIHGGEVEGKEALQSLIRDLVFEQRANVLDSIVLLALPVYNADGNDRLGPQERNRGSQQGPPLVGERANAQGLDLNRDYVKAEAPETRGALALFERWDPDLFVDLHTTDGSHHGYALTYAASLNPAAVHGGTYARDSLLPELRRRMHERRGLATFDYGNFVDEAAPQRGWATYDSRPRFGTNYYGLRGRIAILSEAYSHEPFGRRVRSTESFVREILSLAAERSRAIMALSADADRLTSRPDARDTLPAMPLRAQLITDPPRLPVLVERVERTGDTVRHEAGMPRGLRRTGDIRAVEMPVQDRFEGTLHRTLPAAYAVPAEEAGAVRLLRLHGIRVERLRRAWSGSMESFTVAETHVAPRPFQGHRERRLEGHWNPVRETLPEGTFIVPVDQRLGLLAFYLLEPESDDGLVTWNQIWRAGEGTNFPVRRVLEPVGSPRHAIP